MMKDRGIYKIPIKMIWRRTKYGILPFLVRVEQTALNEFIE